MVNPPLFRGKEGDKCMKRERPTIKGRDAEIFLLRVKLNEERVLKKKYEDALSSIANIDAIFQDTEFDYELALKIIDDIAMKALNLNKRK